MRTISRGPTALLVFAVVLLSPPGVRAQQAVKPKRVLMLYWDDRDHPANIEFEREFQAAVRSAAPGPIEFYSEFLESNRFPGERQSELLRDYIKQKYRDRTIDVVVPNARAPLEFLFKYRSELFPHTPIVFSATGYPTTAQLQSQAGATGIVFVSTYRKTLDLALRLHPSTEQVFIVSGTMTHDRTWENLARSQLNGYESKAAITYLTDVPLKELTVKLKNLPKRSIVLYIWQQALDEQGRRLESHEVFKLIAPTTTAPIYGMSFRYIGLGMVGGYVWTQEANTAKLAQITLKVVNGARAPDIPVENAPDIPMFDWGQLRWWSIPEDRLPKNSVIRFRELPLWPQYKWYVIGAIGLIELETLLIGMLLVQRRRAREGAAALVKTQAVLRESEERFRRVFEEGPLGLALVGKDYHFLKVNRALCQMVGYSEAELLQQSFVNITHPDDVQSDVELAERLFRKEIPFFKMRKRYVKKNGEIIWIDLTGSVIRDKEGEVIYGLAMIENITEVKRAQEEALARQKLESLGVLAGGIAHDFNNLLGSILASTELALTERADGSAVDEELQRIKTTSIRGAEIVQALMIYGGKDSPAFDLLDLSALVNEMLELLKVSISKHTILKIALPQDLPPIRANAAQMRQVVMNLVTNASEAIGVGPGEIRVTCDKVKVGPGSPRPGVVDLAEGDYLRLGILDTGGGMTPDVQARIFDPFFSSKGAGRGLGLAAVQGIVRSHGGAINVESAHGLWSRFEVLLPCIDQAAREPKDITASPSNHESGSVAGTVLVIEDEETLRLAVSKMLRKFGFSVIEAGDGTTGVKLFRVQPSIDVVLLDMTLPGMSGPEVLEQLRIIKPGVKVILTTAFSQASILSSISEQHLWGYIRKPYQLSELTSLLRMACLDEPKITGHAAG